MVTRMQQMEVDNKKMVGEIRKEADTLHVQLSEANTRLKHEEEKTARSEKLCAEKDTKIEAGEKLQGSLKEKVVILF